MAEAKKIYIRNKRNGVTYIYLDEPYWDKEKQCGRHRRKCIGKLGEDGREEYNDYYRRTQEESGGKEILSVSKTVRLGERLICAKVSKEAGLSRPLVSAFGKERAGKIESLACYQMCSSRPFAYAEPWLEERGLGDGMSSEAVSTLLSSITEDEMSAFSKLWLGRNMGKKSILFDITSVSSYSSIPGVERGHNRDRENLEQINLALLSTYDTKVPLMARRLNGSLSDVTVLTGMVETLRKLGVPSFSIMADRGFYSDKNLRFLHERKVGFTIPVPSSVLWQKDLIRESIGKLYRPECLVDRDGGGDSIVYARTVYDPSSPYGRVWKHVYYDPVRKERETARLMGKLNECREELESGDLDERNRPYYEEYFTVKETPKRGRKVRLNDDAVRAFVEGGSCYWVIVSSVEKDAGRCLRMYRERNNAEVHFDDLKNAIDCGRLRVHNGRTLDGKLFVSFIALILISRLRDDLSKIPGKEIRYWNWREVLAYSSSYGKCSFRGKYKDVYTVPTKGQRQIFKALGIPYYWRGELVNEVDESEAGNDEKEAEAEAGSSPS